MWQQPPIMWSWMLVFFGHWRNSWLQTIFYYQPSIDWFLRLKNTITWQNEAFRMKKLTMKHGLSVASLARWSGMFIAKARRRTPHTLIKDVHHDFTCIQLWDLAIYTNMIFKKGCITWILGQAHIYMMFYTISTFILQIYNMAILICGWTFIYIFDYIDCMRNIYKHHTSDWPTSQWSFWFTSPLKDATLLDLVQALGFGAEDHGAEGMGWCHASSKKILLTKKILQTDAVIHGLQPH